MSTRAAEEGGGGDENPSKRRRIKGDALFRAVTFDDINNDCLVLILSHLGHEDMNSFAMCNRRCREARSHESLDQTRTGTIVWRESTTWRSLYKTIVERGWNRVFIGNRTCLRVKGIERQSLPCSIISDDLLHQPRLPGVTSLDISCGPRDVQRYGRVPYIMKLSIFLPNCQELDLSYVRIDVTMVRYLILYFSRLTRLTWKGSERSLFLTGYSLKHASVLTELYLDCSIFPLYTIMPVRPLEAQDLEVEQADDMMNFYMFMECRSLERLSIKGATWFVRNEETFPVTQEMIIKMVRHHTTLRWLRSDLMEENIAMLKRERPEVTFVTD